MSMIFFSSLARSVLSSVFIGVLLVAQLNWAVDVRLSGNENIRAIIHHEADVIAAIVVLCFDDFLHCPAHRLCWCYLPCIGWAWCSVLKDG